MQGRNQVAALPHEQPFDALRQVESYFQRIVEHPWVTLIELALIGAVVYTILRLLQGTPGARLVRAVLTILGVSFVVVWLIAERFEFDRINVLYPYFILAVFLSSLVAFQSDLRRILAKVGERAWFQHWLKTPAEVIDPLVRAVGRLSKERIGTLIAIERSMEMSPWSESGVAVDALLSSELLETIFWPGSPLHDLGVIVREGRIVAAGCQFPLAEWGHADRSLGSRHRAALGLSEESNAVIIIVSEETGTVSVAIGGRLRRGLTLEELRSVLLSELAVEGGRPSQPQQIRSPSATLRQTSDP
ncbi:MAG: diadenylate cyclase CdaA [Planctomycetota bacterium]